MDKETLSHYGWIVILVLILSVLLAFASPFGTFIADGFKATYTGLFQTGDSAMDMVLGAVGVCDHEETEIRNISDTYTGDTCCKKCGQVLSAGETVRPKIPEGGVYYVGVTNKDTNSFSYDTYTAKYGPGEEFPETINNGDIYRYGDYEYRYNYHFTSSSTNFWSLDANQGGWGANTINDNKATYGELLSSINGAPVNTLKYTFGECESMQSSPVIPDSVTNMQMTFAECYSLKMPPVIPEGVQNMRCTFYYCKSLTTAPTIPSTVNDVGGLFNQCNELKTYVGSTDPDGDFSKYKLSSTSVNINSLFNGCKYLTKAPVLPTGATEMYMTFAGCSSLTNEGLPTIPDSVKYMSNTFQNCTSITDLSDLVISNNVTSISYAFRGCTSLIDTGMPNIPSSVTEVRYTFADCTSLKDLSGFTLPSSIKYMDGTFSGCTALEVAPVIPASATGISYLFANCTSLKDVSNVIILTYKQSMQYTFQNCTSLTGDVKAFLASNMGNLITGCFAGTTQPITIVPYQLRDADRLQELANTSSNGNIIVGDVTVQQ